MLFVAIVPLPLHGAPAYFGDFAYAFTLTINLYLLIRRVVTQGRTNNTTNVRGVDAGLALEIASCVLPWLACPLRFFMLTEHQIVLGVSSALGWMRFLQDAFKFSSQLGPLVLLVSKMLNENVLPFVMMYACFFCMVLSLLTGAYQAMGASTSVWECIMLLFQFTIGPSTQFFGELEV